MTFTVYGVYMAENKQSRLFSFRVPANLADEIDAAVRRAGKDKSSWVLGAVLEKLGRPDDTRSPETRLEELISQMESLIGGAKTLPATGNLPAAIAGTTSATPLTAKEVIAGMVEEARMQGIKSSNKR